MPQKPITLTKLDIWAHNNRQSTRENNESLNRNRARVNDMMKNVYGVKTSVQNTYNGTQPEPNADAVRFS